MRTKNTSPRHLRAGEDLVDPALSASPRDSRFHGNDGANLPKHNKLKPKAYLGFTLVELMVTITILIILGTIAFLGFSSYTENARDSVRVSDLAHIWQGLEIHYADQGYYPMPSSASGVTFSGGVVWYQGTIGDDIVTTLNGVGAKLSKKPTDPIYKNTEYAYSLIASKREYQLGTAMESSSTVGATPRLTEHTYAASSDNPSLVAYTKGNYNGIVAKSATVNNTTYYLALPSIVLQDISTAAARELTTVATQSGNLVLHSKSNIPSTYVANGVAPEKIVNTYDRMKYSDDLRPIAQGGSGIVAYALTGALTASGVIELMSGTYAIYSSSNLHGATTAAPGTNSFLDNGNSSSNLVTTYENIFDQRLGIATSSTGSSSSSSPTATITNSLMFNGTNNYLSRTPSIPWNQKKWTWSGWIKDSNFSAVNRQIFSVGSSVNDRTQISWANQYLQVYSATGWVTNIHLETNAVMRDPSAWYHVLVITDTTQASNADRVKIYINGVLQSLRTATYPSQDSNTYINSTSPHRIGSEAWWLSWPFWGYLSEVNFVDSGALDPTAFGQFDSTTGQWTPKAYTGSYGTNGFHLDFSSWALTSGSNVGLGRDSSGNGNYWNTNNMTVAGNWMIDTPTNNFAVLNPLDFVNGYAWSMTLANGNLSAPQGSSSYKSNRATFEIPKSGKWAFKAWFRWPSINGTGNDSAVGLYPSGYTHIYNYNNVLVYTAYNNTILKNNVTVYGPSGSAAVDSSVEFLCDADAGTAKIIVNGSQIYTATGIVYSVWLAPGAYVYNNAIDFDFWQKGYTPSDASYKILSTANLPTPTIVNPKQYFDVLTYTGTSANQSITWLGFQPDLVWAKIRSLPGYNHTLTDSVRGVQNALYSNTTDSGATDINGLSSFDPNGFSVGIAQRWNYLNQTYVAWNWRAGWAATSNTDGTIASQVSANPAAGFSIVSFTAPASGNFTVGHGLGSTPALAIVKRRDVGASWNIYHKGLPSPTDSYINFDTNGSGTLAGLWNAGHNTNTLGLSVAKSVAASSSQIAYVWSETPWFSRFGSYTGNGNQDGPFVYTGFKPKYIMIKRIDTGGNDWNIHDSIRGDANPNKPTLQADLSNNESTDDSANYIDFTSNGFKLRATWGGQNALNSTYIYAAFAEAPFKYATAR